MEKHRLRVYESIEELIASPANRTPMVKVNESQALRRVPDLREVGAIRPIRLCEDGTALSMLDGAEVKEVQSLLEPSSGNTGVALAAIASARGVPAKIVVFERVPEEKKTLLKTLGAFLWEASDGLCLSFPHEGARGLASSIAEIPWNGGKYVRPNQYEDEQNVLAHYRTTGPGI